MAGITKYITWSGGPSGDFICDGDHDEVQFQAAFNWVNTNPGNTIKMRGSGNTSSPHKYHIQGQFKICSNVRWTAEPGVCLFIPNGACGTNTSNCVFPNATPVIGQLGSYITNVEIDSFEIDGNCQNQSTVLGTVDGKPQSSGSGVERLIQLKGGSGPQTKSSNIYIHNMYTHDAYGEFAHISFATDVRISSCTASNHQHDCFYFAEVHGDNNEVTKCTFYGITDSTGRLEGCQNLTIHDNYFYSYDGANNNGAAKFGHNCLQIANNRAEQYTLFTNNVIIYNNYFEGKCLCGVWINDQKKKAGATAQNVHIHHNSFRLEIGWADWAWWSSGINIGPWGNGVLIENNLFDGCYGNAIQATAVITSDATHTATVRNNAIINTMGFRAGSSGGPSTQGYGIWNAVPTLLTIRAINNYMSGNVTGDYKGFTPTSISEEPIESVGPGGGIEIDDPVDPVTPTPSWFYIPSTARILSTDFGYVERAADDYDAYINGIKFGLTGVSSSGGKVVPKSRSPGIAGSNLGDLGFEGSTLTISCLSATMDEAYKTMAAFGKIGRSFVELGGPYKGYFVSGVMPSHGSSFDKLQGDIADEYIEHSISFDAEYPYVEWMKPTIRSRYITGTCSFTSSDIRGGNLIKNPNFASWTPKQSLEWKLITRDAVDNDWQNVKHSPELNQWCAVAKTGTNNRIMVSGPQLMTDLSGDYNTGIYTGDVTPLANGLNFGGESGYIDIPLPDIANATDFTIYTKINTSVTGANQTAVGLGRYTSSVPLLVIWINASGNAVFYHRDDSNVTATITGGLVADNQDHEICLVKSGTTYTLYVDNVVVGTTTATIGTCSVNEANIGRTPRPDPQYLFKGNIYSTRFYSRALSSTEVPKAYLGTTGLIQAYANPITDEPGNFWATPPSLARLSNPDQLWIGLTWCSDWKLWVAISSSQSGHDCAISPDGVNWTLKATPTLREWSNCIFIPKNTSLPAGRLIVFAKSGTGARSMYTDNQGDTWTEVAIPSDVSTNSISASAYSPSLQRVVAVCSGDSATKRVIYTNDFGVSYTSVTSPAQTWVGIVWADLIELFSAVSEDGTNQVMTSPSGLEGTWTQRSTPYAYTESGGTGTVVKTLSNQTQEDVIYEVLATNYTTSVNPIVSFILPALSNGDHYRLDNVRCQLKIATSGATASIKFTAQTATIAETTIKEWPEPSTSYQDQSFDCLFEGAANEAVTIRAYLKTSSGTIKAVSNSIGYTASEMTSGTSTITYHRNIWTGMAYARDLNLIAVVCKDTDHINYVMYSSNGINYYKAKSLASQAWSSIRYSDNQGVFVSVAGTGTARVQISKGYGNLENVPPSLWRKVTEGMQASYLHTVDSDKSFLITGDGTTEDPGEITQPLSLDNLYDSGELYILQTCGYVEGLNHGSFRVDIYAGGTVVKELKYDANTTDILKKEIKFRFEKIPSSAYIRIRGVGTPNEGSKFYCGFVLVSKMVEYDEELIGSEIVTDGYYDCVPNIKLRGVGTTTSSGTSNRVVEDTDNEVYPTNSASYELIKTVTLPALAGGSKYQLDKLKFQFKSDNLGAYVYCKTTIQAASLFGGAEKDISIYSTNLTDYQPRTYEIPWDLISATNETVTLRWYIQISNNTHHGVITNIYYRFMELLDVTTTSETPIYLYNASDTRRQLQICNRLPAGFRVEINKDSTGSIRYVEPFDDDRYITNAYKITGNVARNQTTKMLEMASGSAYEIKFDTLFAVSGVPFVKMYVLSGIPQVSIAADVEGVPGTYYSVDGNTSQSVEKIDVLRQLNSEASLKLRGLNKFYVKIEPLSGQTCIFGQMLDYASLDTIDAQRISIFAADKPNTIGVYVGGDGKCSAVLSLEYRKTNIPP